MARFTSLKLFALLLVWIILGIGCSDDPTSSNNNDTTTPGYITPISNKFSSQNQSQRMTFDTVSFEDIKFAVSSDTFDISSFTFSQNTTSSSTGYLFNTTGDSTLATFNANATITPTINLHSINSLITRLSGSMLANSFAAVDWIGGTDFGDSLKGTYARTIFSYEFKFKVDSGAVEMKISQSSSYVGSKPTSGFDLRRREMHGSNLFDSTLITESFHLGKNTDTTLTGLCEQGREYQLVVWCMCLSFWSGDESGEDSNSINSNFDISFNPIAP